MHRGRFSNMGGSRRTGRNGFLVLGDFREIVVVGLFAGLVLAVIVQANAVLRMQSSSSARNTLSGRSDPVHGLDYDRDRQSILVQSWPSAFEEISLSNSLVQKKEMPQDFAMAESSELNSTTIMLSVMVTQGGLFHNVHIIRQDELLLSEEFELQSQSTADVRISMDGSVAVVIFHDGLIVGWDLDSCEPVRWQHKMAVSVFANGLSPDGRSLFIVSRDGDAQICDAHTGETRVSMPKLEGCSRCVAWSHNNRRVAVGDNRGMIYIFDAETGKELWRTKSDLLFARALVLSFDGSFLVVAGFDKTIRIWDWSHAAGSPQFLVGSTGLIRDFVLTDSETKLVAGCVDGTIREWSLDTKALLRQIR